MQVPERICILRLTRAVFFDTSVMPRDNWSWRQSTCAPLSLRAPVANISLTLYLFSPDSAKVLIQFLNTLVAFARDMFFRISERTSGRPFSEWNIQDVSVKHSQKLYFLSTYTYLMQLKIKFSLAKRGIVNEHKDFFVINCCVKLVQANSSPSSLSRIKHFCCRISSLKRFVFFRHDRSRYFPSMYLVCPKSI